MSNGKQQCSNCKFSHLESSSGFLHCRINPPTIIHPVFMHHYSQEDTTFDEASYLSTTWPVITPGSWCGKWEMK